MPITVCNNEKLIEKLPLLSYDIRDAGELKPTDRPTSGNVEHCNPFEFCTLPGIIQPHHLLVTNKTSSKTKHPIPQEYVIERRQTWTTIYAVTSKSVKLI